jgi:hypothetical protein
MCRYIAFFLAVALMSCSAAGASPGDTTMSYHWEGGFSPYGSVDVRIGSDGTTVSELEYQGQRTRSEFCLAPSEVAYFRMLFDRVVSLDRQAIEVMATDAGTTTWRMTDGDNCAELSYVFTDNGWARELQRLIWRIVDRHRALDVLSRTSPDGVHSGAYDVLSDLQQGRIIHSTDLASPLREALRTWPLQTPSPHYGRDTARNLVAALALCEPAEQWAGDVMEVYETTPADFQLTLLAAVASDAFYTDSRLAIVALGELRDLRALDLLGSDLIWDHVHRPNLAGMAAHALCRLGLPGVEALVQRAMSDNPDVRRTARNHLRNAVQLYSHPTVAGTPQPGKVDAVRRYLDEHGFLSEEHPMPD